MSSAKLRQLLAEGGVEAVQRWSRRGQVELGRGSSGEVARRRVDVVQRAMTELDVELIIYGSQAYPLALLHVPEPPPLLFVRGELSLLDRVIVAVVGSRQATEYGLTAARMLAQELAGAGVVVSSGLARGIDGAAHQGALEAGGGTIAVLGCGVDIAYPREHAQLQEEIARRGLLLSEFLPGQPPLAHHFPRRNRIIAGLSRGVVVVEAPMRSGALITAGQALELGKDVFAVPGPITRVTSAGTNALLRDGAHFVMEVADVLDVVGVPTRTVPKPTAAPPLPVLPADLPKEVHSLWAVLDDEPRHVDDLSARTGLAAAHVLASLLRLELNGLVRQVAGKRYLRTR